MASKSKNNNPLNGMMHTAGIFSDMSVDGPEIGTLILIIDRAKNLPNRKTIGKQDPYCAARLGKEAKKTTTDIRGGQTPRWDQELRFTVHDSPDYFQLKLSVFNDDKKTELIGETWIDLRDIIVPGGGQSDHWHNLNCRGKYAGNIRIEITYYDSRPKPEKLVARPKPVPSSYDPDAPAPPHRGVVKRRPLPSDPSAVQGRPHGPDPISIPSRGLPNPLNGSVANQPPSPGGDYPAPPSRRHPQHQISQSEHYPPPHGSGYQLPPPSPQPHRDFQSRGMPENYHAQQYETDPFYQAGPPPPMPHEYNNGHPGYGFPPQAPHHRSAEDLTRPPPPPAHRSRNTNGPSPDPNAARHAGYDSQHKATPPMRHGVLRNEAHRYSGSGSGSGPLVPVSPSAYPGRPTYRPYESAPSLQKGSQYNDYDLDSPPTGQPHPYDFNDAHHRPMQPTVEDVPESWTPPTTRSRSSMSQYNDPEQDTVSNSASFNGSRHGDVLHERYSTGQLQLQGGYDNYGHGRSPSPAPQGDYSQALTHVPRPQSYQHYQNQVNEMESQNYRPKDLDPSSVPATLVPGVDPNLARKASQQFNQDGKRERRYTHTQPMQMVVHSRGRQHSDPPSHYAPSYSGHGDPVASRPYERSPTGYPPSVNGERSDRRGVSPNPSINHQIKRKSVSPAPPPSEFRRSPNPSINHTIKRKSVSPAPPPSEFRRSPGVPFGPDSYDVLNPAVAAAKGDPNNANYTNANGKIVTPDGREVDPSDHLPADTWAPEPEARKPTQSTETRSRPVPSGAQPMPPSGRRPLRITTRPQSMALTSYGQVAPESVSPSGTTRNRLQKKPHRASALPASASVGSMSMSSASAHQRMYDYDSHSPSIQREFGGFRPGTGSMPSLPAKAPMMSGGLGSAPGPSGSEELALMAEMSRIHIGTERSRRHGRY